MGFMGPKSKSLAAGLFTFGMLLAEQDADTIPFRIEKCHYKNFANRSSVSISFHHFFVNLHARDSNFFEL